MIDFFSETIESFVLCFCESFCSVFNVCPAFCCEALLPLIPVWGLILLLCDSHFRFLWKPPW